MMPMHWHWLQTHCLYMNLVTHLCEGIHDSDLSKHARSSLTCGCSFSQCCSEQCLVAVGAAAADRVRMFLVNSVSSVMTYTSGTSAAHLFIPDDYGQISSIEDQAWGRIWMIEKGRLVGTVQRRHMFLQCGKLHHTHVSFCCFAAVNID